MAEALTAHPGALLPDRPASSQSSLAVHARTTLVVENMHCGGCLGKVEAALKPMRGVAQARANLSSKRVTVLHDPAATSVPALVDALAGAGFRAAELVGEAEGSAQDADRDYLRRLAVAGFAAANIMLLSVSVWSGAHGDMPPAMQTLFHWLSALIALPAVAYSGQPFFRSAAAALSARRVNMDVPISLGVLLATGMSIYQTARGSEQVYFDAAVTLLFFLLVGRALDSRMRVRAAGAAANLVGLRSAFATVIAAGGQTIRMAAHNLEPRMTVLTAAGERFAVDGRIVAGVSDIDESLITGETRPRAVEAGDTVYAGTINLGQPVTVETVGTGDATLVAEIGRLMSAAEQGRARYVRLADRAARIYAPAVHALGFATFTGWMVAGHGWEAALTAAIAVLIITCPCALALAVPAVQVAATSRLFSRGILVKAPDALERIAEIDTVVLDKTGTLTLGEPSLSNGALIPNAVLERASAMAASSRHPYARAVVGEARRRGLEVARAADVAESAGLGLSRQGDDGEERLGSAGWCGIEGEQQASLWYCALGMVPVGFVFTDRLRPDAPEIIATLRAAGLDCEMLSGDVEAEVVRIAGVAGIESHRARVKPAGKLERLGELGGQGRKTLMVGDGLNDAPALAAAHASLSPVTAADISQATADVVFQGDTLAPVVETIMVARETQRMALQNFAIALGYNAVFIPLAVVGLVTPLIAAIAMSASSVAVTANAVRLKGKKLQLAPRRKTP